jgi:hypothetical protein
MKKDKLNLILLKEKLIILKLDVNEKIPEELFNSSFFSMTKTKDEISIVCEEKLLDLDKYNNYEKSWNAFKINCILDFSLTGIISNITTKLAENNIPVFVISTFNTDYILIKKNNLDNAINILNKFYKISFELKS